MDRQLLSLSVSVTWTQTKLWRWLKCQVDDLKNKQGHLTKEMTWKWTRRANKGPAASRKCSQSSWQTNKLSAAFCATLDATLPKVNRQLCSIKGLKVHTLTDYSNILSQSPMSKYGVSHFPVLSPVSVLLACNPSPSFSQCCHPWGCHQV